MIELDVEDSDNQDWKQCTHVGWIIRSGELIDDLENNSKSNEEQWNSEIVHSVEIGVKETTENQEPETNSYSWESPDWIIQENSWTKDIESVNDEEDGIDDSGVVDDCSGNWDGISVFSTFVFAIKFEGESIQFEFFLIEGTDD